MNRYADHQKLADEILLACSKSGLCRVWKNATGSARSIDGKRIISFGLKGSPDIVGILSSGRWLGIEVKTGKAVQSKEQKAFQQMVEKYGGLYIVARTVEDATSQIQGLTRSA